MKTLIRIINIIYIIIEFNLIESNKKNIISFLINKLTKNQEKIGVRIKLALEKLGPIFIKLGQILSTRIDIIPKEISEELKKLQTNTSYFSVKEIKKIIEKETNEKIEDIFEKFNENPIASASIAQIHTGVLKNKNKVIIKIVKPDVEKKIIEDIKVFKKIIILINIFTTKFKRLKLKEIANELEESLNNELDLKNEAINASKLKNETKKSKEIYIPKIYWEYTKKNILIMEYIEGINILNKNKIEKNNLKLEKIIKNLINSFYKQSFKYDIFHADLHPGNIFITYNSEKIILLDFGIVSSLNNKEKKYLSENILAFSKKNYKKVAKLHIKSGSISNKNNIKKIEKEIALIFEPILNKSIKNISFKETFFSLMEISKKFKMQLQPKFILFQKTLITIESISRNLYPNINLWETTRKSIEKI